VDERTRLVAAGYDRMADRFAGWAARIEDDPRERFVAELERMVPQGSELLELGVGAGVSSSRRLAERYRLTGVDLSEQQLRRAAESLPEATLIQGDIATVEFPDGSFDAVVTLYVLNHLPRELLRPLMGRIVRWLRPGGVLLATFGAGDLPDWEGEWLGVPMFFSGYEAARNTELVREAGLEVAADEVVTIREPEGDVAFHWVMALNRGQAEA
jgi:SAM-dependent methyltransferase